MTKTFLWHDYESTGANPRVDRAVEFAAIRTDEDFNEVGSPIELICAPSVDVLPNPFAVKITGITPQHCEQNGVNEYDFFRAIHTEMSTPGTCSVGYNNLVFDDEITRFGFYRSFLDPYGREYLNGNSKWDVIDLARTAYALRPTGIEWPDNDGKVTFKLTALTEANGIAHDGAHGALSDVRATIDLARRIKQAQPKLVAHHLGLRDKRAVQHQLGTIGKMSVLVTRHVSKNQKHATVITPIAINPMNRNEVIYFDLTKDPENVITMDDDALAEAVFKNGRSGEGLYVLAINKCPSVSPVSVLQGVPDGWLNFDIDAITESRDHLVAHADTLVAKVARVYRHETEYEPLDADSALYERFMDNDDHLICADVHSKTAAEKAVWVPPFRDQRLQTIYPRFIARNWPEYLSEDHRAAWEQHVVSVLNGEVAGRLGLEQFEAQCAAALADATRAQAEAIHSLREWVLEHTAPHLHNHAPLALAG